MLRHFKIKLNYESFIQNNTYHSLFSFNTHGHGLKEAIESTDRTPANMLRDQYRNPHDTLTFFGIKDDMVVVELSPGGGWYTEILANYIHQPGKLIAAHFDPQSTSNYYRRSRASFEKKLASAEMYKNVEMVNLFGELAKPNSVDAVITFRNLHNCLDNMDVFCQQFQGIKARRILVWLAGASLVLNNYEKEQLLHRRAIFKKIWFDWLQNLDNANPLDVKDYENGVWTCLLA